MSTRTEILALEVGENRRRLGGEIPMPNRSKFYHGVLLDWCRHFGIKGNVLLVGENGKNGGPVGAQFKQRFPAIERIETLDLEDADHICDLTVTVSLGEQKWEFVICQAVLEHVFDPVQAIRNMVGMVDEGYVLIHTHGPEYPEHKHPVDCIRFLRDFFLQVCDKIPRVELADLIYTPFHCAVIYRVGGKT